MVVVVVVSAAFIVGVEFETFVVVGTTAVAFVEAAIVVVVVVVLLTIAAVGVILGTGIVSFGFILVTLLGRVVVETYAGSVG